MRFRVLFLSFDYLRPKDPNISLASASIISYLKQELPQTKPNIELSHLRLNVCGDSVENTTSRVIDHVNTVQPHVIATGLYVWNEVFVSHAFHTLSRNINAFRMPFTIFGGPQITYAYKGTLEACYPHANAFIRGYAEHSMLKLIVALSESQSVPIDGVHYSGSKDSGSKSKFILGSLPSPLLSRETTEHTGFIRMETKRGCNFKCRFCQHRDTYDIDKRENCSLERIEREVEWILTQSIDDISIVDPIFNTPSSHYIQVMDYFIKYKYKGRLNLQSRLEMVNSEYIDRCNQLMANGVNVELEFGVQTVNKDEMKVIDRPQSLKLLKAKAEMVRCNAIPFEVSLIYGLPMQTVDSFNYSVRFVIDSLRPSRLRAWPLMLLRGTKMFDMKADFNLREKVLNDELQTVDDLRIYNGIPHVISSSTFTESDWNAMKSVAHCLNSDKSF